MPIDQILFLLRDSGLNILGADGTHIWIVDPTCFTASVIQLLSYAWAAIAVVTVLLIAGWAWSLIRGGTGVQAIANNMANLILIFGTLSAAGPIVNFIYGDDLWNMGCQRIGVPITMVQEILDMRERTLARFDPNALFETLRIHDTHADTTIFRPDIDIPTAEEVEEYGIEGVDGIVVLPAGAVPGGRPGAMGGMPGHETMRQGGFGPTRDRLFGNRNNPIVSTESIIGAEDAAQFRRIFAETGMRVRPDASGAVGARRATPQASTQPRARELQMQ